LLRHYALQLTTERPPAKLELTARTMRARDVDGAHARRIEGAGAGESDDEQSADECDDDAKEERLWEVDEKAEHAAGADDGSAFFPGGGRGGWQYAVVLTKVDKGGLKAGRRAAAKVRKAIAETGCPQPCGVVVTSASKKVGRGEMWRLIGRRVLAPDEL